MENSNNSEIEIPKSEILHVPTMAEMAAEGKQPEILFWVGCAGSFDERAQKITRDICKILNHVGISFAVLGTEESFKGKKITYHDPCYLGRGTNVYEAPRTALELLDAELVEMKRCKSNGLCCGAGDPPMFKEPEKGNKDINVERMTDILESKATVVAAACPFCMTMLRDGVKHENKEEEIQVLDIAEITVRANGL